MAARVALRDGSAAARSVAEEDAIQLQQLRGDLTSTQEQLLAASRAHEGSKLSVEVLKTKLKEKIELSQRALKDRQKAQVMRVAPGELGQWLEPASGQRLADHLYLVDPLGNWMMRFPAGMDAEGAAKAKRDLERLLRASSSWDNAGRT